MLKLLKKRLALLLAAALIMTSGTFAFAAEDTGDGASLSDAAVVAEETKGPVSDPSKDPTTWSKDPYSAAHTYLLYLTGITGYDDADMVSADKIFNGKKLDRKAVTGDDLYNNRYFFDHDISRISYNCIPIEGDTYVIYAYGIEGGEFGLDYNYNHNERNKNNIASTNGALAASVNDSGLDVDSKPAGVFDYSKFTWSEKGGDSKGNGKIIYDAAVIQWTSGQKAKKLRLFEVENLYYKNNLYATVSYCATKDGRWQKLTSNAFQKTSKQPSFYPKMRVKKSYRDVDGTKVKSTNSDKKLKNRINKVLKSKKIEFEIRRRPIAGTVSEDYLTGENDNIRLNTTFKYVSVMGDDLDFKDSGKLKKATVQFKSETYKKDKDADSDDAKKSTEEDGAPKAAKVQAKGYYITHALKMQKLKSSDVTADLESKLLKGEFKKKTKKDLWYTTKNIGGFDTLIVYGAQNLEGVAAFRKRSDKSVGSGYYNSDTDCFITSLD
jgi:hypothetical protein